MYLQPAIYPIEKGGHVTPPVAIDSQLGNVIQGRKGSPAVTVTQIVERVEKDGGNARSMAVWRCLSSGLDIENYKTWCMFFLCEVFLFLKKYVGVYLYIMAFFVSVCVFFRCIFVVQQDFQELTNNLTSTKGLS